MRYLAKVRYIRRVRGGTVKCFYKRKYKVWKTLTLYRASPHKFRVIG